jgi:nucleoid-associated protein YgaU
MNKITLIWTLIAAVPVGAAALATAYVYHDTGKLPFQESVSTAPETGEGTASAPAGEPAATAENEAGPEETDDSAATDTASAAAKGPSFDVVGVEPTGETVVAGRSDAGAIVALTANGKVVGKSIANEAGEWTIILDEPLKPGDYDVGLEVHDETGAPVATSEERLAVSLPEGGKEQPLVVLNSPDRPSDILQKPEPETAVADAKPETGTAAEETVAVSGAATQAEEAASGTTLAALPPETQTAGSADTSAAAPDSQASTAPEQTADDTASASGTAPSATPAGTQDVSEAAPPQTGSGESAVAAVEEAGTAAGSGAAQPAAAEDVASAPEETMQQATTESSQVVEAPASGSVTVEAVESEKGKVFVAGTGNPGASVRVYVGDEFQGEAKVNASGRWLVEGSKSIAEGDVEVRADQIGDDGNSVDARAAVTFEKEQDKQIVLTKVVATGAGGGAEGQGAEVKKSLPVVIIRKGDNLWRISRRLYGDGIRYTTIYQANQDQIRNPDLIYPGQVFLTPEGDLNWKPAPENNG